MRESAQPCVFHPSPRGLGNIPAPQGRAGSCAVTDLLPHPREGIGTAQGLGEGFDRGTVGTCKLPVNPPVPRRLSLWTQPHLGDSSNPPGKAFLPVMSLGTAGMKHGSKDTSAFVLYLLDLKTEYCIGRAENSFHTSLES